MDAHLQRLRDAGVQLEPGLSPSELVSIESAFGFRFPEDLRALLSHALPVSEGWVDWRHGHPRDIAGRLAYPAEGVAPYFLDHEYWLPTWGQRPDSLEERMQFLANAPTLLPVCGNHYISAEPPAAGNPVFSVVGIDLIVFGVDLEDYLHDWPEGGPTASTSPARSRRIRFWSDFLDSTWSGWVDQLQAVGRSMARVVDPM